MWFFLNLIKEEEVELRKDACKLGPAPDMKKSKASDHRKLVIKHLVVVFIRVLPVFSLKKYIVFF